MENALKLCHRCSASLPEDALCCPQCGSPQLVLTEADAQRVEDERAAVVAGAVAPPRVTAAGRIRWRPVLHIVVATAVVAGVSWGASAVVPPLGFIGLMLIFFGPLLSISLYQHRVPGAAMSAGIGARIGAVLGLLTTATIGAAYLITVLVYRYAMHHSAEMDTKLNAQLAQNMTQTIANYPQLYPNPAQAQQVLQFMQSPDGHVTLVLFIAAVLSLALVAYSVVTGAMLGVAAADAAAAKVLINKCYLLHRRVKPYHHDNLYERKKQTTSARKEPADVGL